MKRIPAIVDQVITVVERELNIGTNVQKFGKKFLDSFQLIEGCA